MPRAPPSRTARSISATAASGLFIGRVAIQPGKRSGWAAQIPAMPSLRVRASAGVSSGPAQSSITGLEADSTWR